MSYDYLIKCILVGESGVGKSSLLLQFTEKKFSSQHEMTIGVEFGTKNIKVCKKIVRLQIWDTAGQESFRSITKSYYKESGIVLLVYNVCDLDSFLSLSKWLSEVKDMANEPHVILVGNKSDLTQDRKVTYSEGKQFADDNKMLFIETSAIKPKTVEQVFELITTETVESIQRGEIDITDPSRGIKPGQVLRPFIVNSVNSVNSISSNNFSTIVPSNNDSDTNSKNRESYGYCC